MNNDRPFLIFLAAGSVLLLGVFADNLRTRQESRDALPARHSQVDIDQLRRGFSRAGIIPREARFWKPL